MSAFETVYSFRVTWRFLDVVATAASNCQFIPGEACLKAITKELEQQCLSTLSYCNANGVIPYNRFGIELVLLETSGPFSHDDIKRETQDHIKALYDLLAMLHTVAYEYVYADIDIFKGPKVYFVHAFNNKIRLWTLNLVGKELYVLNRVSSSTLPTNHKACKDNFVKMTNMLWDLKRNVEDASQVVASIKKSHETNQGIALEGSSTSRRIERLDAFLTDIAEVKLSSRISEAEDVYVYSSPFHTDFSSQ